MFAIGGPPNEVAACDPEHEVESDRQHDRAQTRPYDHAPILPGRKLTRSYRPALNRLDGRPPGVAGLIAELLLDPDQLVVLGQTIRPRDRAGFDLSAIGRNREIGDRRVLRLAGPVRYHSGVAGPMRHIDGGQRLGERANLVDLDEDRIGDAFL